MNYNNKTKSYAVMMSVMMSAACSSDPVSVREQLQSCGLLGAFEVRASDDAIACGGVAMNEDSVEVSWEQTEGIRVHAGKYDLPATLDAQRCVLVADGCESMRVVDDGFASTTFRSIKMTFEQSPSADSLIARQEVSIAEGDGDGEAFRSRCEGTASFSLVATQTTDEACNPVGTFLADQDAPLVEGSCGLAWRNGTVRIEEQADGLYTIDWSGTAIEDLSLDFSSCTLSGTRGVSMGNSFDYWSYNNAAREVELTLSYREGRLEGVATDKLNGETFDGVACAGGSFALFAEVPEDASPVRRFEQSCAEERPVICGDGVCDAERGETCRCSDCACAEGSECEPQTEQCLTRCEDPRDKCGPGLRCSEVTGERLNPEATLYCIEAGDVSEGQRCTNHNECGAGLLCHYAANRPALPIDYGLCTPICDAASEQCERCMAGERSRFKACEQPCSREMPDTCASEDAFCWNASTLADEGLCVAEPPGGLARTGEDCDIESSQVQCEPPGNCIRSCRDGDCFEVCTPTCDSAVDCPAAYPVCQYNSCFPE